MVVNHTQYEVRDLLFQITPRSFPFGLETILAVLSYPYFRKSIVHVESHRTMDDEGLNISPQEIQKLNPTDYKELQQFLANEGQKSQVQKSTLSNIAKLR